MCSIKHKSYDDYSLDNGYYPMLNEIPNEETKVEILKIVNMEYDIENIENLEHLFDHLKSNQSIQIEICYKTLGNIYKDLKQYENAIKAYTFSHQCGSPNGMCKIATVYNDMRLDI